MPIPFDMIAVMLYLGWYAGTPVPVPPPLGLSLPLTAGFAAGTLVLFWAAGRTALRLVRRARLPAERRRIAALTDTAVRVLLAGIFIAALETTSLPWSLAAALGLPLAGESFAVQLAGLLLFIVLFLLAWLPMYQLSRETGAGVPGRAAFVIHKARYNLFMLLAWVPFALLADWLAEFLIILPVLFLAAAWAFPFVLARAWGCRPLPEGEILNTVRRLEALARSHFSQVYLWDPGSGVQNAAAVGIFPPFRYLFLTPALIRGLTPAELDAVILHELGHVRKKHLLFYLVTSLAGINAAVFAGSLIPAGGSAEQFIITLVMVLAYFRIVFGWLSRNMERQADLFALEKSGSAAGLVNALEKLGIGAGNIRLAASWHHMGIAERTAYLRRAERDSALARFHNTDVTRLMTAGYLAAAVCIGFMTWAVLTESAAGPRQEIFRTADTRSEQHWRRIIAVLPDSAHPRLELAYRLASRPETRNEAAGLAEQALRLSKDGEEREAAKKLLRDLDTGREP